MAVNTIEDVRPGEIISSDFMNALLKSLRAVADRVATLESKEEGGDGGSSQFVATGLVERGNFEIPEGKSRATPPIKHDLGSVEVAIIIGFEEQAAAEVKRPVDRYYATGIAEKTFQLIAEVTKPYDGTFRLISLGGMDFFDHIRWWAIKQ